MKKISVYLTISLVIISGIAGYMIGYSSTYEYRSSMYGRNLMDLGAADKWLDLRYVNAMISHHRGAMLLAEQAQNSSRDDVRNIAKMILENEPAAIEELYNWKEEWYGDTKEVKDPAKIQLGNVDEKFDLRFLNTLIAHHENGVAMTEEVRTKSSRVEVLNNADAVEKFLKGGIVMLKEWRKNWYGI